MRHSIQINLAFGTVLLVVGFIGLQSIVLLRTVVAEESSLKGSIPTTPEEARGRARLLHETIHGALQVVHRDFYREDEGLTIPSQSLEDVFGELADNHNVTIRWLAVNAQAMNIDNKPEDKFEQDAVTALTKGKESFELVTDSTYRYVGQIRLGSQCLKCHLPSRTSNKARKAGLVITMPLKKAE